MNSHNGSFSESPEDNLRCNVVCALCRKGYPHHRTLKITTDQGTVTVQGTVPTYYLRQVAIECIKRVTGVVKVIDRIQVNWQLQDDNTPFLHRTCIHTAPEEGRREAKSCSAIGNPMTEDLASPELPGPSASHISIDDKRKSPDPWFRPQIKMSCEAPQLQPVCG